MSYDSSNKQIFSHTYGIKPSILHWSFRSRPERSRQPKYEFYPSPSPDIYLAEPSHQVIMMLLARRPRFNHIAGGALRLRSSSSPVTWAFQRPLSTKRPRKNKSFFTDDKSKNALFIELKIIADLKRDFERGGGLNSFRVFRQLVPFERWKRSKERDGRGFRAKLYQEGCADAKNRFALNFALKEQYEARLNQLLYADMLEDSFLESDKRKSPEFRNSKKLVQLLTEDARKSQPLLKEHENQAVLEVLGARNRRERRFVNICLLLSVAVAVAGYKLFHVLRSKPLVEDELPTKPLDDAFELQTTKDS